MVRGFMYTLEATIAVVLILSTIIFIYGPDTSFKEHGLNGYNCMKQLDYSGNLRYYASNNMQDQMKSDLEDCITRDFDLKICQTADCVKELDINETVTSTTYVVSGYDQPENIVISLWVW